MEKTDNISGSVKYLYKKKVKSADIAIISGSGQGWLDEIFSNPVTVPYMKIPGMPRSGVKGHENTLVYGSLSGMKVLLFNGRFHIYEGFSPEETARPVRIAARLGVRRIIITNAAGGINNKFHVADLMIIKDHVNLMGTNPLIGYKGKLERFISMNEAYSKQLGKQVKNIARKYGITMHEGVYSAMPGPSYETPAEIRLLRKCGVDAVGMSTVPEVIVARQEGMEVLALSVITNSTGRSGHGPSHDEVLVNSRQAAEKTKKVIQALLEELSLETRPTN